MNAAAADLASGKGHNDENFPVASWLIEARYRTPVMAFYRFARIADDVADHPTATAREKLRLLEQMRATLAGKHDKDAAALGLRKALAERALPPIHALDLLEAFRRDVVKQRYESWDELMDYCRYSAAPVGRMVLDIHGEDHGAWPANDALCAALQVINHLQDCAKDYRELDRVYLPTEELGAAGVGVEALAAKAASPGLRLVITSLARRTGELLQVSRPFASQIRNGRLRAEVTFIQRIAEDLTERLARRDPLSERVTHSKLELAGLAASSLGRLLGEPRHPRNSAAMRS
jgi:squalene synthase HpnC